MTPYTPGDILLVNDYDGPTDWLGAMIRAGERARGDGNPIWTHSALIINTNGDLVEALASGVARTNISKYARKPTKIINLPAPAKDPRRAYAVRFAVAQIGDPYGVADFVSLGLSIMFNNKWSSHEDGKPICSELVGRATESMTDVGYPYVTERVMPSDFDRYFDGVPPLPPLKFWQRARILLTTTAQALLGLL